MPRHNGGVFFLRTFPYSVINIYKKGGVSDKETTANKITQQVFVN